MKFSEKVRLLKKKVGDKILFVQNGNFYIAIGRDAVLLNELFNLKCTCFIKYLCKVGVPVKSLSKYLQQKCHIYIWKRRDKEDSKLNKCIILENNNWRLLSKNLVLKISIFSLQNKSCFSIISTEK